MNVEIRTMISADIRRVCAVVDEAFGTQQRKLYGDTALSRWLPAHPARITSYLDRQPAGAFLAEAQGGRIVGVNFVRTYAPIGWFHTLGVVPDVQGGGVGTRLIKTAMNFMSEQNAHVQGLVTWPQAADHIALYSKLGFRPADITLLMWRRSGTQPLPGSGSDTVLRLGELDTSTRGQALAQIASLCQALSTGLDYTSWLLWTEGREIGDTLLWYRAQRVAGFALFYELPYVTDLEIKLLVVEAGQGATGGFMALMEAARRYAEIRGRLTLSIPMQTRVWEPYRGLLAAGFKIGNVPMLRMVLDTQREAALPVRDDLIDRVGAIHCLRLGG